MRGSVTAIIAALCLLFSHSAGADFIFDFGTAGSNLSNGHSGAGV